MSGEAVLLELEERGVLFVGHGEAEWQAILRLARE